MDDPKDMIPGMVIVAGVVILFMLPVIMFLAAIVAAVFGSV